MSSRKEGKIRRDIESVRERYTKRERERERERERKRRRLRERA